MRLLKQCMLAGIAALAALYGASEARAEYNDVVVDARGNVAHSTYGDCVYTKWMSETDNCDGIVTRDGMQARSYQIFFDFDSAMLTENGSAVVKSIAEKAGASHGKLMVVGHADRSGSDAYNMGLSKRRAQSVQKALAGMGVDMGSIMTDARGEREPLVPTADGVREPQNRRVEITLSN